MPSFKIGARVFPTHLHANDGCGTVTALGTLPDGDPMVQVQLDRRGRKVKRYPARFIRRALTVEQALRAVEEVLGQDEWNGADDMPEIADAIGRIDPRDRARCGRKA